MRMSVLCCSLAMVLLLFTGSGSAGLMKETTEHTPNVRQVGSAVLKWPTPVARDASSVYIRDLAFAGRLMVGAIQGGHGKAYTPNDVGESGIAIFRIGRGNRTLQQLGSLRCHAVGYVSVVGDLVFQGSVETTKGGTTGTSDDPCDQEGLRIIDISNPAAPRVEAFVDVPCGVQPLTVMRSKGRLYVYAPSTCREEGDNPFSIAPLSEMTVFRVDPDRPSEARVVRTDSIFPMSQCEQFTIHTSRRLGACFGDSRAGLFDLSDAAHPRFIPGSMVATPFSPGGQTRLAFSWDGNVLAIGNGTFQPQRTGSETSVRFFDIEDVSSPRPVGKWSAPQGVGSDAGVLTLSFIPTKDGRRLLTVGHGHRGMYVVDATRADRSTVAAYFNGMDTTMSYEGELPSKALAAHWYNGRVFFADRKGRIRILRVDDIDRDSAEYFRNGYNPLTTAPDFFVGS